MVVSVQVKKAGLRNRIMASGQQPSLYISVWTLMGSLRTNYRLKMSSQTIQPSVNQGANQPVNI